MNETESEVMSQLIDQVLASRIVRQCEYRYPPSSAIWKKSMHVVHTAADPPNHGRMILAMIGCT